MLLCPRCDVHFFYVVGLHITISSSVIEIPDDTQIVLFLRPDNTIRANLDNSGPDVPVRPNFALFPASPMPSK